MRWYAGLLALLLVGAAATAWLTSRGVPDGLGDLDPSPIPVSVEVVSSPIDFDSEATLSAARAPGPSLLATGLTGTVTSVNVTVGDVVSSGSPLYPVNGITIHAYTGAVLFRPITAGDSGDDVRTAQELLSAMDLKSPLQITGIVDSATLKAISALAQRVGAGKGITSLSPDWFVHLPTQKYTLQELNLVAGSPAPAAGAAIAGTEASFSNISLTSPSAGPEGSYNFLSSGASIPVEKRAGSWVLKADSPLLKLLMTSPADGPSTSAVRLEGRVRLRVPAEGIAVPGASWSLAPTALSAW